MKKVLKVIGIVLLTAIAGITLYCFAISEKEPQGTESAEAELLTQKIYAALNKPAWDSTQWVKWTFRGGHEYLWDKHQNRVRVRWSDQEVLLDLATQSGPAKKAGTLLSGDKAAEAAKDAYKMFCNDGFWLMAPYKLTDPGTKRMLVTLPDGRKGLKVAYGSGGVTPGDSYVWIVDEQGIPTEFKMWVGILPIGGISGTWEKWITLPTGAKLSTFHLIGGKLESPIVGVDGGMGAAAF